MIVGARRGQFGGKKALLSLLSSCILQVWQVGGGELQQGAAGSKQTAGLKLCAFAEDLVAFEVSSIESKGGSEGNRVYVDRVRIGRAAREGGTSYRSVKPLS